MLFRHCEYPSKINNLKILFAQGAKYDNQNNEGMTFSFLNNHLYS